jgi:flagellar protein FliS
MASNSQNLYLESRILSADPVELVQMLYQGALESIESARKHLKAGDIAARSQAVTKACDILIELTASLDHSAAGDFSRNLLELYDYMSRRLLEANFRQSDEPLAEVAKLLSTLLEGWLNCKAVVPPKPAQPKPEYVPEPDNSAYPPAQSDSEYAPAADIPVYTPAANSAYASTQENPAYAPAADIPAYTAYTAASPTYAPAPAISAYTPASPVYAPAPAISAYAPVAESPAYPAPEPASPAYAPMAAISAYASVPDSSAYAPNPAYEPEPDAEPEESATGRLIAVNY